MSVANAITSMRTVDTYEWRTFFEWLSLVERVLRNDRDDVYAATAPVCRARYRRAIERIARASGMGEVEVARRALELASRGEGAHRYVGYYLVTASASRARMSGSCAAVRDPGAHPSPVSGGLIPSSGKLPYHFYTYRSMVRRFSCVQ